MTEKIDIMNEKAFIEMNRIFEGAQKVAILTHVNMDADALGSAMAMCLYLRAQGKQPKIYGQQEKAHYLEFFDTYDFYDFETKDAIVDVAVAIDCANISRFEDRKAIFDKAKARIIIDHHVSQTDVMVDQAVIDPSAAATAVLVWEFFKVNNISINKETAENLYYALSRDTGGFRHGNTDARAFMCAADLMKTGLDVTKMTNNLFYTRTYAEQKLRGIGLNKLELLFDRKLAICCITNDDYKESGAKPEDAETVVDSGREILGVDVSIVLRETDSGVVRVNFRSKDYDVRQIAEFFNGGGHEHAAGCSIESPIEEAKKMIVERFEHVGGLTAEK